MVERPAESRVGLDEDPRAGSYHLATTAAFCVPALDESVVRLMPDGSLCPIP
jgi:hypothetical protein